MTPNWIWLEREVGEHDDPEHPTWRLVVIFDPETQDFSIRSGVGPASDTRFTVQVFDPGDLAEVLEVVDT